MQQGLGGIECFNEGRVQTKAIKLTEIFSFTIELLTVVPWGGFPVLTFFVCNQIQRFTVSGYRFAVVCTVTADNNAESRHVFMNRVQTATANMSKPGNPILWSTTGLDVIFVELEHGRRYGKFPGSTGSTHGERLGQNIIDRLTGALLPVVEAVVASSRLLDFLTVHHYLFFFWFLIIIMAEI